MSFFFLIIKVEALKKEREEERIRLEKEKEEKLSLQEVETLRNFIAQLQTLAQQPTVVTAKPVQPPVIQLQEPEQQATPSISSVKKTHSRIKLTKIEENSIHSTADVAASTSDVRKPKMKAKSTGSLKSSNINNESVNSHANETIKILPRHAH